MFLSIKHEFSDQAIDNILEYFNNNRCNTPQLKKVSISKLELLPKDSFNQILSYLKYINEYPSIVRCNRNIHKIIRSKQHLNYRKQQNNLIYILFNTKKN